MIGGAAAVIPGVVRAALLGVTDFALALPRVVLLLLLGSLLLLSTTAAAPFIYSIF